MKINRIRGIKFLLENSLFLILGAVVGLIWANLDPDGYHHFVELPLFETSNVGAHHDGHRVITLHYLVNDILMALFFAIAGKEVWEATLPGGALSSPRKAATPLIATLGGIFVPVGAYVLGAMATNDFSAYVNGWAIPTATDIAFSYMVARLVFGATHPAIPFLLLLAIADDAIGLIILAIFYPQEELQLAWLGLAALAVVIGLILRRRRVDSFWPYLAAGVLSWYGFVRAGIHPALGLLPIIPTMPHAHLDTGLFEWSTRKKHDTLNAFEHWWKNPVELVLGLFGLLNAGVTLNAFGPPTYLVLLGLLVGKPLGVWVFGLFSVRVLGFRMPRGLRFSHLFVIGCAASIGFTVALFISSVAFEKGPIQEAAKIGALGSFLGAIMTVASAKILGIKRKIVPTLSADRGSSDQGRGHGH